MVGRPYHLNIQGRMGFLNEGFEEGAAGAAVRPGAAGRRQRVHAPRPGGDQAANGPIGDAIAETYDHGVLAPSPGSSPPLAGTSPEAGAHRARSTGGKRAAVSRPLGIPNR